MIDYIGAFYNIRRRRSWLDYRSPVEFELKNAGARGFAPVPVVIVMNDKPRAAHQANEAAR